MEFISSEILLAAVYKAAADTGVDIADTAEVETSAQTEETEKSTPGILKLDWTIIWAIVNILILFVLMRIVLFKPVNKLMEERTASIRSDIEEAEKSRKEAEAIKAECASAVEDAKAEAKEIIERAKEEAASEKEEILRQSHAEAAQIIEEANQTIENERKKSMQQAQTQIADLAIAAASKIMGENMDDSRNRKLVDDFLAGEEADKS